MKISYEKFIEYLKLHEGKQSYRRGPGAEYKYRLEVASRPVDGMPYTIIFHSPEWEKEHEIAPCFAVKCLREYNEGHKDVDDYVAETGPSRSRRGRYLFELLRDVEAKLGAGV